MKPPEIVHGARFAAEIATWRASEAFAQIDADPVTGAFGRSYYPAVFGARRSDDSFAVTRDSVPLLIAACTSGEGALDYYGMPLRIFMRAGLDEASMQRAVAAAFAHLDALA